MNVLSILVLLAHDRTRIVIRDDDLHVLATGFKSSYDVELYWFDSVSSFTWQNDGNLFIDLGY